MRPPPMKWRDPHDLERREGRFELRGGVEDTGIGLLAASLWLLTGDARLGLYICPDSALRLRGCRLLTRLLRCARGGQP